MERMDQKLTSKHVVIDFNIRS